MGQVNSDLPIEIGDEVKIYEIYEDGFGREFTMIVSEISAETIKGELSENREVVTTVRWDEISRIEHRQPDSAATITLVVLALVLVLVMGLATADAVKDIDDSLEDAFDDNED